MDFARKILQNFGWKEGDGLGKNRDGIAKPLKASLKFDNAGFGADQAADDFNNHWWERVFNEAATNVNVGREGEKIKMSLKDDSSVEISTKGYSVKKLKKLKKSSGESNTKNSYENFLRAATLTNLGGEVENADKIDAHDIEVSKVSVLSDEELFKACGGRTAHKGARHGLKLNGKLLRIEQQEADLLAKMMKNRNTCVDDNLSKKDSSTISAKIPEVCNGPNKKQGIKEDKRKKKKRKYSEINSNDAEQSSELAEFKSKKEKLSNTPLEMVQNNNYDKKPIAELIIGECYSEGNLKKAKKNKKSGCLEEKTSRKKKKKNKEKCKE